jgi:hypothetical protein
MRIYIKLLLDRLGLLNVIIKINKWKKRKFYRDSDFNVNGFKVFELVVKSINENNIIVWPTFGTLLGLVRDKKLLDYDNDLDFGCFFDADLQVVLRENLLGLGFKRVFSGYVNDICVLDKFMYDGVETDFYYFLKDKDHTFSYDFIQDGYVTVEDRIDIGDKIIPYKNVYSNFDFKRMELVNISFNIPDPINSHLKDLYGKNYNIPDKNWHNNKRKNRHPIFDAKVIFKNL